MQYLMQVVETYRIDSEKEVEEFINQEKKRAEEDGYILKGYSSDHKDKKSKGEIVDEAELVKLTKVYGSFWEV
jgi:hypothetical protein